MKTIIIAIFLGSVLMILSGCGTTSSQVEYNSSVNDYVQTKEIDDDSKPTVTTEIPANTNEEVITQEDTNP